MKVKYPRTYHLPYSLGVTSDDKVIDDISQFDDVDVVVTIKMDGENSTLGRDYTHARSLDSKNHPSRDWLKQFHAQVMNDIPEDWRVCGENLYAKHSIEYSNLKSYFLCFSIWSNMNVCLSWDVTVEWANLLGIETVPVLYRGKFDDKLIHELFEEYSKNSVDPVEGYVVRVAGQFDYADFKKSVAKWVRPNHVQTDVHWMHAVIVPNKLKL